MSRHALIIAADFAPSSLPPALRIRFFATHLAEFGWTPTVVTTDPQYYDRAFDNENLRLVPKSLRVIRTKAISAEKGRRFGIGCIGMRSLLSHWEAAARICSKERVDIVFISVPPYLSCILGRLLWARFGIPYVLDYIDPWVTECYWRLPRDRRPPKWPLAYALARTFEPFALGRASAVTAVSKGTIEGLERQYNWLRNLPSAEIPYGAEMADFEYLNSHGRKQPIFDAGDGYLHLSYVGTCSPSFHPAVSAVFRAVRSGLERNPNLFGRLRIHFVGTTYAGFNEKAEPQVLHIAKEHCIDALVDEHPARVSYLDSLQILRDSLGLLLIGSEEPHYTASKVFPSILSGRPLLAVFHEKSSVVEILRTSPAARVVTFPHAEKLPEHTPDISAHIEDILTGAVETNTAQFAPGFESYATRAMAGRLAAVFDSCAAHADTHEV